MTKNFKSHYTNQAEFSKAKLDEISPSFCLAKWLQVSIHLTNGMTHSCYHPPVHKIPIEELKKNPSALHNTNFKKQERKQMKEGSRPSGCSYCWMIEDGKKEHFSDRYYRSGEPWAMHHYDEVVDNPWDYNVMPRYVEVNFNNACNLKCSYCSPHLSSTWAKEIKEHGPYKTSTPHNSIEHLENKGLMPIPNKDNNPYIEAFWKWWPELYPNLKHFRMTGGEPLMDKNTYKVLDYISRHAKKDLQLGITTNFCPDKRLLKKFFEQSKKIEDNGMVEHFMLFVSCDAVGKKAEYIRHGMNYDYLIKNVKEFLSYGNRRSISFINTFNLLSVTTIKEWLQQILDLRQELNKDKQKIWIDTPMLRTPTWQSIQILPVKYRDYIKDAISWAKNNIEDSNNFTKGIKDYEIDKLHRMLQWMEEGDNLSEAKVLQDRANFYIFFSEHDKRRGTNFLTTFPEMEDFWDICKKANERIQNESGNS